MGCEASKPRFDYQELKAVKCGKPTRGLPPPLLQICAKAVKHAEEKLSRPVYVVDISASWKEVS